MCDVCYHLTLFSVFQKFDWLDVFLFVSADLQSPLGTFSLITLPSCLLICYPVVGRLELCVYFYVAADFPAMADKSLDIADEV